jgi:hypothetical protein
MNLALSEVGVATDYRLRETAVGDKQDYQVATCRKRRAPARRVASLRITSDYRKCTVGWQVESDDPGAWRARSEIWTTLDPRFSALLLCAPFVIFRFWAGDIVASFAFPVFTPDPVAFLFGVPSVAPVGAVAPLWATVFGLFWPGNPSAIQPSCRMRKSPSFSRNSPAAPRSS